MFVQSKGLGQVSISIALKSEINPEDRCVKTRQEGRKPSTLLSVLLVTHSSHSYFKVCFTEKICECLDRNAITCTPHVY